MAVNTAARTAKRRPTGQDVAKRASDIVLAVPLLLITLPAALVIVLAIRLDSPGPALFRQERVGRRGKRFVLWKFRTMHVGTPELPTDEMARLPSPVTRVGRWLRRTSLDELPQLVNILRGEMSFVGPRPALPSQTELNAGRAQAGVDALLPGLTGWAQVNGRDDLELAEKLAHDVWYLRHRGFLLDVRILGRTLRAVLGGHGNH